MSCKAEKELALPFPPFHWEERRCAFPTVHGEQAYSFPKEKELCEILDYAFLESMTRKR